MQVALHLACQDRGWKVDESRHPSFELTVTDQGDFLALVNIKDELVPPVRVTIENRLAGSEEYLPSAKDSVIEVATAFLEKSARRGILSEDEKTNALSALKRHYQEV